jgi:adenosyl cobinamide kinase/adenosyl cobinamide phosphate guanylyltransferase
MIVGPRNCGKSDIAERELLMYEGSLEYFATLPVANDTRERIDRHRLRRDARWSVYEMAGELLLDLPKLQELTAGTNPLLMDGLFMLIGRLAVNLDPSLAPGAARSVAQRVCHYLERANCAWIVVDPRPEDLRNDNLDVLADVMSCVHERLISHGKCQPFAVGVREREGE